MSNSTLSRLLRKNTSPARVAGFILSNFIGLLIIAGGLQFYMDARNIWESDDNFISTDYLVVNRKVTSANTLEGRTPPFSAAEIDDLKSQPWTRAVGEFTSNAFRVRTFIGGNSGRNISTDLFFESIPDRFVDVPAVEWNYKSGSDEVPIIISKDYLTLYNFGFAGAAGLPQLSEQLMGGIPLTLDMQSDDGTRHRVMHGRVVGFSNRLNTILVPESFMQEANTYFAGSPAPRGASRLIIDVNSPGDTKIAQYLDAHDLEQAGDKSASSASFMLKVITGIIMAIGAVITILSFFILLLSISLIMEKNKDKIHSLIMLGYPLKDVGAPYRMLIAAGCGVAFILAIAGAFLLRAYYMAPLQGLGAEGVGIWPSLVAGAVLTALIILFNILSVNKKIRASFRVSK